MARERMKGRIVVPDAPANTIGRVFRAYKPETEQAVRKIEVVQDKTLKRLKDAFRKLRHVSGKSDIQRLCDEVCLPMISGLGYSASDVQNFSATLAEFQGENEFQRKAGLFLSTLINNCEDKEFVIHTGHLVERVDYLGSRNTKKITVDGHVGRRVGEWMHGGKITVGGNTGEDAGCEMMGGTITVEGNAGEGIGLGMEGGAIRVEGSAGDYAGAWMKGGAIAVNGDIGRRIGWQMDHGWITVDGHAGDEVGGGMKGGMIIVEGDSGGRIGWDMKGGMIIAKGAAGDEAGVQMGGGEICIDGDIGSISEDLQHGKIFHKGKRIVDK